MSDRDLFVDFRGLNMFMVESNRIEEITGTSDHEMDAATTFLRHQVITVDALVQLVRVLQPGAALRMQKDMDVSVGDYLPPLGGPEIFDALDMLLDGILIDPPHAPYDAHQEYETLHPFTDGNGRSGRLLWLWMMGDRYSPRLGFLHTFYYQALEAHR